MFFVVSCASGNAEHAGRRQARDITTVGIVASLAITAARHPYPSPDGWSHYWQPGGPMLMAGHCERLDLHEVAALDRRDFQVVAPRHLPKGERLKLLPED